MTVNNIYDYIQPGKRAHLVGIGGVSMASLAECATILKIATTADNANTR